MKFVFLACLTLLCYSGLSEALPKDINSKVSSKDKEPTDGNKIEPTNGAEKGTGGDKSGMTNYNPSNNVDGSTGNVGSAVNMVSNDDSKSDSSNLPPYVNKKCPGVKCYEPPPPNDAVCEVSSDPSMNIMAPLMGGLSDCCPLYLCTRKSDGSFFTQFGKLISVIQTYLS